jgi:hypothetical protein
MSVNQEFIGKQSQEPYIPGGPYIPPPGEPYMPPPGGPYMPPPDAAYIKQQGVPSINEILLGPVSDYAQSPLTKCLDERGVVKWGLNFYIF